MGEACAGEGTETCRRGPATCMGAVSDSGPERRESRTRARDDRASPQGVGTRTGGGTSVEASVGERVRERHSEREIDERAGTREENT